MIGIIMRLTGLSKLWGYLAVAGAAIVGFLALWFTAESKGRGKERAKQTKVIHEKVEKADKVRRDVRSDPVKRKRVRKFDRNR